MFEFISIIDNFIIRDDYENTVAGLKVIAKIALTIKEKRSLICCRSPKLKKIPNWIVYH